MSLMLCSPLSQLAKAGRPTREKVLSVSTERDQAGERAKNKVVSDSGERKERQESTKRVHEEKEERNRKSFPRGR